MQTLTIEKGNEVLRFNPAPNGDVELSQQILSRGGDDRILTEEETICSIPKSERARIAHFLVTGEAIQ